MYKIAHMRLNKIFNIDTGMVLAAFLTKINDEGKTVTRVIRAGHKVTDYAHNTHDASVT